jgi:dolichol-phosphate mannosyltransferase
MKLCVVIPAYNEAASIEQTVVGIHNTLDGTGIPFNILVVNDGSRDETIEVLDKLKPSYPYLKSIDNTYEHGFGLAVRFGLDQFEGDCVAIMMADASDSPEDLVRFYNKMQEGYDCVFGTRWSNGGKAYDYPRHKYYLNRLSNRIIKILFNINYDDVTNAFKLYNRKTIEGLRPFLSPHFNLTVELPLKAIIRDYSYAVVPNSWYNRKHGTSNLKIREMGSRYFFILLYCLIEKYFSMGDYKKHE